MCGIVGLVGNLPLNAKKAFSDLLVFDTVRGFHSTGAYSVSITDEVRSLKAAVSGPEFVTSKEYEEFMDVKKNGFPQALVGHNRWATVGGVNKDNAHPFECEGNYLVHNGSLTRWRYLDGANKVNVDSNAILTHIVQNGVKETLEELEGSFAITYFDKATNSLYIARNEDRPMYICYDKKNEFMMFASEKMFIKAAAERAKLKMHDPWFLKAGAIMRIDLDKSLTSLASAISYTNFVAKEPEPYTGTFGFRQGHTANYRNYSYPDKSKGRTTVAKEMDKIVDINRNKSLTAKEKVFLLENHFSLVKGQIITCSPEKYTKITSKGVGFIEGTVVDHAPNKDKYHGMEDPASFRVFGMGTEQGKNVVHSSVKEGRLVQIKVESTQMIRNKTEDGKYENKYFITGAIHKVMTVKASENHWMNLSAHYYNPEEGEDEDDGNPFLEDTSKDEKIYTGPGFGKISLEKFEELTKDGCCMCVGVINPNMHKDMEWVFESQPLCHECTARYGQTAKLMKTSIEEVLTH